MQGLSLYIDDMRLLKNIYNAFVIYYNRLNTIELDYNKMPAIIAYKNLFPRDFSDLQLNQGFIYTLFSKKDEFIQGEIIGIQKKIQEKENIITSSKRNYNWDRYEDDELITRDNIIDIFSITSKNEIGHETSFNEIKGSEYFDLLKYLIRNGYIDETYSDYMTYFYENSLSRIDKAFLCSITHKKTKDYIYKD